MGACFESTSRKNQPEKENKPSPQLYTSNAVLNNDITVIDQKKEDQYSIERKREQFIDNFFSKSIELNAEEKTNTVFITNLNKKMRISKDIITVEEDFILKVNIDSPNSYYDSFWMILDGDNNEIISKEIYIENIKVDESKFEVKDYSIKIELDKIFNNQTRKIRITEKIKNEFDNFCSRRLILKNEGICARYIIYLDEDLNLDDISNKKYTLNKELNMVYFEGITTRETEDFHGYINFSKKVEYLIYKYIPELTIDILRNIIINKEINNEAKLNYLAKYKKIVITEYGQDIDEINLMKISNYNPGEYLTFFSLGLYKDIKNEINLVELNNKPFSYQYNDNCIEFNNVKIYNNQFIEVHLQYKYYTNETKDIYRQESVLISNNKNTYIKSLVQIPINYIIISTKDIFKKVPELNNCLNEEDISETFSFCLNKGLWEIELEYLLEANDNIKRCEFTLNKIFKGGNLKEIQYDINHEGNFIDSGDKFIFKYENLNTTKTRINFKIKIENSTSNYLFNENKEYYTQIPPEDLDLFKNLVNEIINSDKTNYPIYKKIGKWVHNNIKYDLKFHGKKYTAKEILNIKQGVCEHFTKLYNTLLTAYGIEAIKVSGFAKDITENNIKVKKKKEEEKENEDPSERHAWTLAKIDGEWVPLDATWDLFDKKVPITHVFQNYGDGGEGIVYDADNKVEFTTTKENIKYIKNI